MESSSLYDLSKILEILSDKNLYYRSFAVDIKQSYNRYADRMRISVCVKISNREELIDLSVLFGVRPEKIEKYVNKESIGYFSMFDILAKEINNSFNIEMKFLDVFKKLYPPTLRFLMHHSHKEMMTLRSFNIEGIRL